MKLDLFWACISILGMFLISVFIGLITHKIFFFDNSGIHMQEIIMMLVTYSGLSTLLVLGMTLKNN